MRLEIATAAVGVGARDTTAIAAVPVTNAAAVAIAVAVAVAVAVAASTEVDIAVATGVGVAVGGGSILGSGGTTRRGLSHDGGLDTVHQRLQFAEPIHGVEALSVSGGSTTETRTPRHR